MKEWIFCRNQKQNRNSESNLAIDCFSLSIEEREPVSSARLPVRYTTHLCMEIVIKCSLFLTALYVKKCTLLPY